MCDRGEAPRVKRDNLGEIDRDGIGLPDSTCRPRDIAVTAHGLATSGEVLRSEASRDWKTKKPELKCRPRVMSAQRQQRP